MSMGHTYKFFGFYISYTILTLPLSIFHLSSMLLILCTFPPLSLSHSPVDTPPCDLHLYGSVPVLVVCLVCSCFCFRCQRPFFLDLFTIFTVFLFNVIVVLNNCEFAVIFTVHIFYLLFLSRKSRKLRESQRSWTQGGTHQGTS